MSDLRDQPNQKGAQVGQQKDGGGQKSDQERQQPNQKPGQSGQQQGGGRPMARDQISFYDEPLKKQIEGSFTSDGKSIHVSSAHGVKSAPYGDLGASIDQNSQLLLAQKLLSELARDKDGGGQQQPSQQQQQPNKKPGQGELGGGTDTGGSQGGTGSSP